ncbi:hypothetical protein E2320_003358 [Naja naja]|nr:hypothetical protein E2320_003358 [Naja naja]
MHIPPIMHCIVPLSSPPPHFQMSFRATIGTPCYLGAGRGGWELTFSLEMLAREEGSFFEGVGYIMFFPTPFLAQCKCALQPHRSSRPSHLCICSVVFPRGPSKNQAADFRIPLPCLFPPVYLLGLPPASTAVSLSHSTGWFLEPAHPFDLLPASVPFVPLILPSPTSGRPENISKADPSMQLRLPGEMRPRPTWMPTP